MKKSALVISLIALSGCIQSSSMPMGNDMMQIDITAAPIVGRAGAQKAATKEAAKATIESGYDKFIVMGNNDWNETTATSGSNSSFGGSAQGMANQNNASYSSSYGGQSNSFFTTNRHPEAKLVIKMFHYKDKGADKAVDARSLLKSME